MTQEEKTGKKENKEDLKLHLMNCVCVCDSSWEWVKRERRKKERSLQTQKLFWEEEVSEDSEVV